MSKLITAEEIIACGPCAAYPHEEIQYLMGDGKTPAEIAASNHEEKLWVLANVLARRNPERLVLWTWDCVLLARGVPVNAREAWFAMLGAPGDVWLAERAARSACEVGWRGWSVASYAAHAALRARSRRSPAAMSAVSCYLGATLDNGAELPFRIDHAARESGLAALVAYFEETGREGCEP